MRSFIITIMLMVMINTAAFAAADDFVFSDCSFVGSTGNTTFVVSCQENDEVMRLKVKLIGVADLDPWYTQVGVVQAETLNMTPDEYVTYANEAYTFLGDNLNPGTAICVVYNENREGDGVLPVIAYIDKCDNVDIDRTESLNEYYLDKQLGLYYFPYDRSTWNVVEEAIFGQYK